MNGIRQSCIEISEMIEIRRMRPQWLDMLCKSIVGQIGLDIHLSKEWINCK